MILRIGHLMCVHRESKKSIPRYYKEDYPLLCGEGTSLFCVYESFKISQVEVNLLKGHYTLRKMSNFGSNKNG